MNIDYQTIGLLMLAIFLVGVLAVWFRILVQDYGWKPLVFVAACAIYITTAFVFIGIG